MGTGIICARDLDPAVSEHFTRSNDVEIHRTCKARTYEQDPEEGRLGSEQSLVSPTRFFNWSQQSPDEYIFLSSPLFPIVSPFELLSTGILNAHTTY